MSTTKSLLLFITLVCILRILTLGVYPLIDPTEGRYAEIPREMLATGDWVVPHLHDGQPFLGKPPLMFWTTAFSYQLFGLNEFAARLPSFLFTLFAAALTFQFGRFLLGTVFGLQSVAVLLTTFLFCLYSGNVAVDSALLATVALSMVSFPFAMAGSTSLQRRSWGYLYFLGLGSSLLAKGLIGPVLILFPLFLWTLWHGKWWESLKGLPWFSGSLLAALIAVPWHILCEIRSPGFLNYYFIGEHFRRFTVSDWEGDLYGSPHEVPFGMVWLYLFLVTLPWAAFLLMGLWNLRGKGESRKVLRDPWLSYTLFWSLAAPFVFTFSRNVMFTYVLPGLPAFAILTVYVLRGAQGTSVPSKTNALLSPRAITVSAYIVPVLFFIAAFSVIPFIATSRSQRELVDAFSQSDTDGDAELVYTDTMPHSGDFYMEGKAQDIPDESVETVLFELRDLDQDYFAIEDDELEKFPIEGLKLTTEVGRFGRYVLRREFDAQDAPLPELLLIPPPSGGPQRVD